MPTDTYDTIAGDQKAPSTEQVEEARRRVSEMDTQAAAADHATAVQAPADPVPTAVASAVQVPQRASPRMRPPHTAASTSRPRPARRRRGRWLPRAVIAGVLIVAIAVGALVVLTRSVYFVGTDDNGFVTLYRGLPYDLPLGIHLYSKRYVSGVPALSIRPARRRRVLDHELRSRSDAADLIRSLDQSETP